MSAPLIEPIRTVLTLANETTPAVATTLFGGTGVKRTAVYIQNNGSADIYIGLAPKGGTPATYVSATEFMWKIVSGNTEPVIIPASESIDVVIIGSAATGNYTAYEVAS